MKPQSLFNLPNLVGCVYLILGIKSILFFERPLFPGYGQNLDGLLSTPLPYVIIFLLLAFFSFRKKIFPLHLLAAYLWVFYVAVALFVMFELLFDTHGMTLLESIKIIGITAMVCLPVFIYSWCLYRYGKRRVESLKSIN